MSLEDLAMGAMVFNHKKNILVGSKGRIIYAKATRDVSGNVHAEGWVLPGGARTQNEFAARQAATFIESLSR